MSNLRDQIYMIEKQYQCQPDSIQMYVVEFGIILRITGLLDLLMLVHHLLNQEDHSHCHLQSYRAIPPLLSHE